MRDCFSAQNVSKLKNQFRNELFKQGMALEKKFCHARTLFSKSPSESSKISLLLAAGELSGYLKVRKSLSPQIATDMALQRQQAMFNKAVKELCEVEV
jgi:hypothetical protein|tara:strand:+ start:376 stop:669 length:294 start_codon:yes stop_codon:yes gene_type:complete